MPIAILYYLDTASGRSLVGHPWTWGEAAAAKVSSAQAHVWSTPQRTGGCGHTSGLPGPPGSGTVLEDPSAQDAFEM